MKIRYVSGNPKLLPTDAILKVTAVVASNVQLGRSMDYSGLYTIKKTDSSANAVAIAPISGEKIDGADSVTLTTENEYKTFTPVEGGWTVVDSYTASPSLVDPFAAFNIGAHSYASAHADWTLSAAELLKTVHKPTLADQAVNAIIPKTPSIPYVFINTTGQALTVKTAAGSGVAITNAKTAIVMADGTNVIALAAESV